MKGLLVLVILFSVGPAFSEEPQDMATYLKACKKMLLESQPNKDPKDAEMLCNDPYLEGHANESKEDKSRRERLLKETNTNKEKILHKAVDKKPLKKSTDEVDMKACKKASMASDPGRDPKDAEMLCNDPYLRGKPGESYDDQVRRKRLIRESDAAKERALDKFVVPAAQPGGGGAVQ